VPPGSKLSEELTGGKWLLSSCYTKRGIDSKADAPRINPGGETVIKKVKGGYRVLSSKGRNMGGPYKTREEALKRLRQVEFFKRQKG
jgi:hypothetical protein